MGQNKKPAESTKDCADTVSYTHLDVYKRQLADIAQKSVGVISQRTIIERHPFVEDADKEMERIAEEKDDSDDIMGGHNERVLEEEEQ